jgi:hypothetical protein
MTLMQALEKGVRQVRLPSWEGALLILPPMYEGQFVPWGMFVPATQKRPEAIDLRALIGDGENEYESCLV